MKGGLCLGRPLFPSIDSIIADSFTHMYAPAPLLKCTTVSLSIMFFFLRTSNSLIIFSLIPGYSVS
ncbi:MAG: hypothetical protein CM15mP40_07930 [Alphaproteobacteria bacterium]|nr:MAG: hypothetical protein CM15mP40_07930 [Alphaproteobacteria bacterium]